MQELLEQGIIELGCGHVDVRDLFLKRGTGLYVVQFFEGPYFRQPLSDRSQGHQKVITDDPLYEPLQKIGVDEAGIRRLFKQFAREQIQKWIRITDAAINERPQAFPGFKTSPAAFLIDGIQNQRMPPDWIYAHEKEQQRRDWERQRQLQSAKETELRQVYESERARAFKQYLTTSEGRSLVTQYLEALLPLYRVTEPHRAEAVAREAAISKVERENFQFQEFGTWLLEQRSKGE